jgi:hypothetical protein
MSPHHVSPFLSLCDGILPQTVCQSFLQKLSEAQVFLYHYSSAVNLDYLTLPDVMRLLHSRFRYPEGQKSFFVIFWTYAEVKSYVSEMREEICKLATAAVVL